MSYSEDYLRETTEIISKLDTALCEKAVELLAVFVRVAAGFLSSGSEAARQTRLMR
jgi:hypothetical protein